MDQISAHEIRIYEVVRLYAGWLTAREIAVMADVADRTARYHALRLADLGIFDVAKVFGGYRYRIATTVAAPGDGAAYVAQIEAAKRVHET